MAQKFLTGVQLTDGSAGSPALSFSSDTNTGIYRSGDDTVNISIGGTNRFHVNSSGIISSANVYSGGNGQFRNYAGVWKATTGVSGNGFEFTSADRTGAMTLTSNGNLKVHNNIRSQGHSTTGLSGKGMELRFFTDTDIGSILSYDRSNNAYLPIGVFGSTVSLQTNGTERLHITNAGNVGIGVTPASIDQKLRVNGNIKVGDSQKFIAGAGDDLQIQHSSTDSFIENNTGNLFISNFANDKDIRFATDDGSGGLATYFFLDGSSANSGTLYTQFPDNSNLTFGSADDLQIKHDGTDSKITNTNGDLYIRNTADDKDIIFQSDDGSSGLTSYFYLDGSSVTTQFYKTIKLYDDAQIYIGDDNDLRFYHNGTSNIDNYTGNLDIIQRHNDGDIRFYNDDGSGGTTEYFRVDGGEGRIVYSQNGRHLDNVVSMYGSGADLQIKHDGSNSYISNNTGALYVQQLADDSDIVFQSDDGSGGVAEYFRVDGGITKTVFIRDTKHEDSVKSLFGTNDDLRILHDGSDSFINSNGVGDLYIQQFNDDRDIILRSDNGSGGTADYLIIDGSQVSIRMKRKTKWDDNILATFGDSEDLQIVHDGTLSSITNLTGNFYIQNSADDSDIIFRSDNGSGGVTEYFRLDGSSGITRVSRNFRANDGVALQVGSSGDAGFFHNGTDTFLKNDTGNFYIRNESDDKDIIFQSDNGTGSFTEYFRLDGGATKTIASKAFQFFDNVKAEFGDSSDLQIYHSGTHNFISAAGGTGSLYIRPGAGGTVQIEDNSSNDMITAAAGGGVSLYYNASKKLETTSTGVTITGDLEVTGTTTTVNQTNLDVSDNIIGLNRGASTNTNDSGIIIERGTTGDNAAILWDESNDDFVFGLTTATPSATGNVSLSGYSGIKTGSITASSDITTSGSIFADTHFRSTDGNATLSATGGGGIYLRPNGYGSTTGQVVITASNGDATFNGGIKVNQSATIHGTDNQIASIYMNAGGYGLSGKFGSYARNLIRSNGTNTIQIGDNTSLISLIQVKAGSSSVDGVIQLSTKNTERMRITHDGKVGVNTSSPGAKLHVVESTTNTQGLRVDDGTSFVSVVPSLGSGGYTGISTAGDIGLIFSIDGDNTTDTTNGLLIAPHTNTSGGLKILENGNVGIGVATPNTKLQVAGIIQSTESGNSAFYGGDYVRVFNNQNFRFRNSGGTVVANIAMSGNTYFNGGNVGIGTTSPGQKLHVIGTARISGTNNLDIYSDNTAGTFNIASSARGFLFKNINGNLLTINSAGQVGVGTSSPQTNTKLEVSGALKAGNKTSWSDRDGAVLTTTGRVVAGLTGNANGNGASALYVFTCYGGNGYQRVVYSCRNQSGTWVVNKDIDEGVDAMDVVASTPSSGSAVTFTFKGRTSNQSYTASVFIEHMGHNLDTQYVG